MPTKPLLTEKSESPSVWTIDASTQKIVGGLIGTSDWDTWEALFRRCDDAVLLIEASRSDLRQSRVVYVNPAYTGLTGIARDAVLGRPPDFFQLENMADSTIRRIVDDLIAGRPVQNQIVTLKNYDCIFHAVLAAHVIGKSDMDADPTWRVMLTLRNIAEHSQVQTTIQKLMMNTRCYFWHAEVTCQDGLFTWDFDVIDENAARQVFPVKEAPGQPFIMALGDARHPDDIARIDNVCRNAMLSGDSRYNQEFRVRLENGNIAWISEDVNIELLAPGRWRLVGIGRDVTHLRNVELELREMLARARCLVWHADVENFSGELHWKFGFSDEEAAKRWLPVKTQPGWTFTAAWNAARTPAEQERLSKTSTEAILSGQSGYSQEFRCYLADGQPVWLSEDVHIESIEPNRWRLVGVCTDITERKRAETETRDMLASARCLVWYANVKDHDGVLAWTLKISDEQAAMRWLPITVSPGQSYSDAWNAVRSPADQERMYSTSSAAIFSGQSGYSQELPYRLADGQMVWVAEDVHIERVGKRRWRLVGVCTDITERKALEQAREQLLAEALDRADRDPLTGLLNHRVFHKRLEEEADRAQREGTSLAIAVMDMDNFKFFNDSYGHAVGDEVLLKVAKALSNCCRSYDTLARFGGDEFAVLMPGTGTEEASHLAERLKASLTHIVYRPPGYDTVIPLNLSVGVAIFPDNAPTRLEALELADSRLMRAKSGHDAGMGAFAERLQMQRSDLNKGFSMLNAMVHSVDNKDRYTRHHSEEVLAYSQQIAQGLGLDEETKYYVQVAALLHDIGKIGVPDRVLRKPGKLTDEEYEAIKQHPLMGAVIVESVPGFEKTLDAIRHHHERWDGAGYPYGLRKDETPLTARLMAVADAYSAMTTDRPYRIGLSQEEAVARLLAGAGTQWDPDCVHALVKMQREQKAKR